MSGTNTNTTAAAAPTVSTTPPLPLPAPTLPPPTHPPSSTAALDTLTTAIYGLQRQMTQFSSRLADVEARAAPSTGGAHSSSIPSLAIGAAPMTSLPWPGHAGPSSAGPSSPQLQAFPYGMPGFGGIPPAPPPTSVVVTAAGAPAAAPYPTLGTAAGAPAAAPYPTLGLGVPPLLLLQGALPSSTLIPAGPSFPPPPAPPTGMPNFHGLYDQFVAPATTSATIPSHSVPITHIPFPHSPSPIPQFNPHDHTDDHDDDLGVPHYYKLSFPTYDGKEDPLGWLNRCEHFFRAQRTREHQKVGLASFHMIGVAQHWFYMLERDTGDINAISWPLFRSLCQQRFGPPLGANHLAGLARLPFRGSVQEYQEMFQARMAHAGYLSPAQQVQLFTGGLPDPLRTDVELQAPADLQRAMSLARAYERRATALLAAQGHQQRFLDQSPPPLQSAPTTTATPTSTPSMPAAPHRQLRRLSSAEMAERRRQGLCYNCDEPYVRGHKCQRLFYLEVSDCDDHNQSANADEVAEDLPPLISLHAITGNRSADTMQVKVGIGNHQFTALLDSGSTRNFISESAAQHVKLCLTASQGATVIVANGDRVACSGLAQEIDIRIGAEYFTVDCYTIPLSCYDMVLGVSYLRTLGSILWDFGDLCMAFWHHGK